LRLNGIHLSVCSLIRAHGQCLIVGGAVRDFLLGKPAKDIDLVTDADLNLIASSFENSGWTTDQVGLQSNVLFVSKVIGLETYTFEIARFRTDVTTDGRHAVVANGDINTDAWRRDFTCNALYYNPYTHTIIDPTNMGVTDIRSKILRFVGKPEQRIKEDYLRVFRYYRFLDRTGFQAHPKSLRACREYFNEACANTIPERIRLEFEKTVGLI
jgi:poly(A) polymerase